MTITADDLARAIYEHIVALRKKHTSHHMVSWEELSPSTRAQDVQIAARVIAANPGETNTAKLVDAVISP
jgi:hypothetical protein